MFVIIVMSLNVGPIAYSTCKYRPPHIHLLLLFICCQKTQNRPKDSKSTALLPLNPIGSDKERLENYQEVQTPALPIDPSSL